MQTKQCFAGRVLKVNQKHTPSEMGKGGLRDPQGKNDPLFGRRRSAAAAAGCERFFPSPRI